MPKKDYSEDIAKRRNKKNNEGSQEVYGPPAPSQSASASSSSNDYASAIDKRRKEKEIGFDTLSADIETAVGQVDDVYSGWQTRETMENTRVSVQDVYDRLGAYQEYQKKYGGTDLSELYGAFGNVLGGWDDTARRYGSYKSAEEYQNAVDTVNQKLAETERMKTEDLDAVRADVDYLEGIYNQANAYQKNIYGYESTQRSITNRAFGLGGGIMDGRIADEQAKLDSYLKSVGFGSVEELQLALGDRKNYLNRAEWVQKGYNMSSVGDKNSANYDPNFTERSRYIEPGGGVTWGSDSYDTEKHRFINDEAFRLQYMGDARDAGQAAIGMVGYEYMTEQEKALYNYYYNTQGAKTANEYLNTITETLGLRKASADFGSYKGNFWKELGFGITAGADQFATGVRNAFNFRDEYIPVNSFQQMSGMVREDLKYEHGAWGTVPYDLTTTTANMLPSVLMGSVTNPALGTALMGVSAAGNAYQEMLNLGYDKGQARVYSTLVGASEALLERAIGGISKLGGTAGAVNKLISGIDNGLARFAVRWGSGMVSEGIEESLQEVLTPLFKSFSTNGHLDEGINIGDVVYSGLLGALSGGIFEGATQGVGSMAEARIGSKLIDNAQVGNLMKLASNPGYQTAYDTYTRYANKGITSDNITKSQAGRLYNEVKGDARNILGSKSTTKEQAVDVFKDIARLNSYTSAENKVEKRLKELKVGEKTRTVSDGKSIEVKVGGITQSGKDTVVITDKGKTDIKDITLSRNDAVMVSYAEQIMKSEGEAMANLFLNEYDGQADADAYANAFNLATIYAKNNYTIETMLKNKGVLTTEQVKSIYKSTIVETARQQETAIQKLNEDMAGKMTYHAIIDDNVIDYNNTSAEGKVNWRDLNVRQREAVTFIKGFAEATGMNLKLIADGKKQNINGAYDVDGNTIILDIYAGIDKAKGLMKDTIIPTASHEVTHWMEKKSPELWLRMNELVFSSLEQADGLTEVERISAEMNRINRRNKRRGIKKEATESEARSEIIARACEDMLSRSEYGRKIFDSMSESEKKTFTEKIKEIIQNLKDWVNQLLGSYKSNSYEARLMRKYADRLEEMSKLWDEMLEGSVTANQALEISGKYGHTGNVMSDGDVASIGSRDMSELAAAVDESGEQLFQYRAMVEDEEIYRDMLLKHKDAIGITSEQIEGLFNLIDEAVDVISENLEALDYAWDADIDDRAFHPVKANSDNLYKVSLDFSTLCRKRLLQQTIQTTLQEALDKPLSKEESIAIRDELIKVQEEGKRIEVACALCYVESVRMKSPKQINKFLDNRSAVIKEFFANKSGGSVREKIKKAEADARETLKKTYPDGMPGKKGAVLDASTAPLKKMRNDDAEYIRAKKREAKASYKLTEHEQAELDAAMKMNVSDFTSAKGLEKLAKEHSDIFDAYTSFVRNATHSKGLENDVWWRAGDSDAIGDSLIRQMNEENGLRSQSWSDFQVIHLLDYIATTIELSAKGAKRQSYTKVPDYVKLLGNTGDMINMSLIPKREFSGKLGYDDVEGMAYKVATELRDKYHSTAGTICIGMDDAQIRLLLEDLSIDMVIPYHSSSMSKETRKLMHIPAWKDYQSYQSEKKLSEDEAKARAKEYGVELKKDENWQKAPKFSEWFDLAEARQIAKMENAHPSDEQAHKMYGVMYGGYMAMQNAANNYLRLCAERGLAPKFSHKNADYTHEANYWKLLIDRKMVDNVTGEIIEQKAIKPIFDKDSVMEILNDELERYPQVKADQEYAQRKVVQKFLSGEMKVDKSTLEAIKKPVENITEVNILESSRDLEGEVLYSDRESMSPIAMERRINELRAEISEIQADLEINVDLSDADERKQRNRLFKLQNDLDKLLAKEKKAAIKTSLSEILENLSRYRMSDLYSLAEQVSEGEWDDYDTMSRDDIESILKETLTSLSDDLSPDEINDKKFGFFVRPVFNNVVKFKPKESDGVLYSERVTDEETLEFLDNQDTIKVYRAMQIIDGKLYPPMAAKVRGEDGKKSLVYSSEVGVWEQATERPELIKNGKFELDKANGSSINAAYNPYIHTSASPLNDQFSSAYKRDNLVTVEGEIPISELTSGYRAEYAKDSVGETKWHSGPVASKLKGDKARRVFLSRWFKPTRIVPDAEVASIVAKTLEGENIGVPYKVVTPSLREELEKSGVTILYSDREEESVYDIMGEAERLKKENEKIKADVERLKEALAFEKKVTGGNVFNQKQLGAVANALKKQFDTTYDKVELMKRLQDVYRFISTSDNMTWEDVFERCYAIADDMLDKVRPRVEVNEYYKTILRDIRNTRISLSEAQKAEAKNIFGSNWNRSFMGSVIIANDGTSIVEKWKDWAELYPSLFKTDISDVDMPGELYDIIGQLRDGAEIIEEYNKAEDIRALAMEIYNQYWNVSSIKSTADKYDKKVQQLKLEHKQAMSEFREDYRKRMDERVERQKLLDDMYYGRKMAENRKKTKERVDNQKLLDDMYYGRLMHNLKVRREVDVDIARKLGWERIERYKESADRRSVLQSLTGTAMALNRKLTTNSKDVHIPEELKPVVRQLLNTIDFSSKKKLEKGELTKGDMARDKALEKVRSMDYENANIITLKMAIQSALELFENSKTVLNGVSNGDVDSSVAALDAGLIDDIKKMIEYLDKLASKGVAFFTLAEMSTEHLRTLNEMVRSINHWSNVSDKALANKHRKRISELCEQSIQENDKLGERQEYINAVESVKKFFSWSNLLPINAFKRLGNAAMEFFDGLRDAQDKLTFNRQDIMDFTDKLLKYHKKIKDWRKEVKTFNLHLPNGDDKTVNMPISYIMSLYCVAKQEDAKRHLYGIDDKGKKLTYTDDKGHKHDGGGITISRFRDKGLKVSKNLENTILSEDIVTQIVSVLNDEQIAVADEMQKYMNEVGSKWGDSVSMELYGIKKFGVENYFPITVTPHTINSDQTQDKRTSLFTILNYGFTKERNPNANQSIEIGDIFDVFANHMNMVAIYNAYALAIYDIARWINYKDKTDKGNEISVRASIENAFGESAIEYITHLIADLNGQHESSRLGFIAKIFKNTKVAMVGNSLSVALLQPTAYIKAMTHISPVYLMKSLMYVKDFGVKKGVENAKKYCGIALMKSQGYFETEVSANTTTKLMHDESKLEKITEWSLWGAGFADERTWGLLWNAFEFEVKAKRKDLEVGSDEYYMVIAEKLRDMIYETQVVDSPLTKSDLMRSSDNMAKSITMFASEITVAYNMVHEALFRTVLDSKRVGKKEALKRNRKAIMMTLTAYTLTSAASTILSTAVSAFREGFHDDYEDKDKTIDDYIKEFGVNFLLDWLIIGKIPYLKEALSMLQGFSPTRTDTLWMESAFKAVEYWNKSKDYKAKAVGKKGDDRTKALDSADWAQAKSIDEALKTVSYVSGVAIYNQWRDLRGILKILGILD